MKSILIYSLHDPRTGELRYVGKTKQGSARVAQHLSRARKGQRTHLATWLRSLMSAGLVPDMRIVEETTERHWQQREHFWINHFRQAGANLTNGTDGGDGGATMKGKRFSDSHRKAIAAALKGHSVSSSVRERVRQARMGNTPPNKLALDEEALRAMYLEQRMTSYQIAAVLNVSSSAIQSRLRKLGIARTNSEAQRVYHLPKAALVDNGLQRMRA